MSFKWIALACLVVQNSSLALMMRSTFLLPKTGHLYLASTAVLLTEIIKLFLSIVFLYLLDAKSNIRQLRHIMIHEVFVNKWDWASLTIPSLLYTLQNSLQYISMSQLSAPVFQLLYQMKIVTTAVFSVLLLSKQISMIQWVSIVALTCGVALVQLSQQSISQDNAFAGNSLVGFISVFCGCVTSGFAGVFFEMILKSSSTSLWVRNIQLSTIGVITSFVSSINLNVTKVSADIYLCIVIIHLIYFVYLLIILDILLFTKS
jgi:UDP-galactose transporter